MFDLEKMATQLAQMIFQRTQHQEMFHKLSGAIEILETIIKDGKQLEDEINGQTDNESTQKPSQE